MTSIWHFPATHPLPDWRNFGVMLRVLLGINVLAMLAALVRAPALTDWAGQYIELAAMVEPLLLINLGLLSLLRDFLWRMPLRVGQLLVMLLVSAVASALFIYIGALGLLDYAGVLRAVLLAASATALLLGYFDLRSGRFSCPDRGKAGRAQRPHPSAFPLQLAECCVVPDSRPAAGGRGGARSFVGFVPCCHARSGGAGESG